MPRPAFDAASLPLVTRLWREHVRAYPRLLLLAIVCTLGVAATTALYPVIIQQAFNRFAAGDANVVWFLPPIIVAVTSIKAITQYGQAVATQSVVLRVIEGLQKRLFGALTRADLAQVAREAPARHAARFTTDAGLIREALSKAISGVADVFTVIGLVASMLWMDWKMALLSAVLYPIAAVSPTRSCMPAEARRMRLPMRRIGTAAIG